MSDFLPDKYEVPSTTDKYMKFVQGENRFRILSSPIIGWELWKDTPEGGRKPYRTPMEKPFTTADTMDPEEIKHFWAMVVWNYKAEKVQILEITQKGIQKYLRALTKDKDWGNPVQTYDLVISKKGEKLETEYEVLPKPATAMDPGIVQLYKDMAIDLTALYRGEDPFAAVTDAVNDEVAAGIAILTQPQESKPSPKKD
jgi:hypothetical protein